MATYTIYPSAGSGGTTFDGRAFADQRNVAWATLRSGAAQSAGVTGDLWSGFYSNNTTSGRWDHLSRALILFDTSAIPAGTPISSAIVSLCGVDPSHNSNEYVTQFDIYTSNPASNANVVLGDFLTFGSVSQTTGPINLSNLSLTGYNDWPLSATGISNIVRGGITKFGVRESIYDVGGATPTWTAPAWFEIYFLSADNGSNKPMLVVVTGITYTDTPSGGIKLNGAAALAPAYVASPTSGIVLGGTVSQALIRAVAPSAGIVLGGSVSSTRVMAVSSSGGLVLGGTCTSTRIAPVTLTARLYSGTTLIASWQHQLTGTRARVSWARLQAPLVPGQILTFRKARLVLRAKPLVFSASAGGLVFGKPRLVLRGKPYRAIQPTQARFQKPKLLLKGKAYTLRQTQRYVIGKPRLILRAGAIARVGQPGLVPTVPQTLTLTPAAPVGGVLVPTVPQSTLLVPTTKRGI